MSGDAWLELAENANAYTPLEPHDERVVKDRYVVWMGAGATWNVAQRFRFRPDEVDDVRSEIHALLRERGRSDCTWEVATHAQPADLVERLLKRGLVLTENQVGMVLTEPPTQAPPTGVEVQRVETDDEWWEAARIAAVAFGEAALPERRAYVADPDNVIYLAYIDGEPVARGTAAFSKHGVTLFGGSTLPDARGRGAYRALVAARWHDAVRRGTPLLVTQASPMSKPILARLGFRQVCEICALADHID
jgi:hypothetical protein